MIILVTFNVYIIHICMIPILYSLTQIQNPVSNCSLIKIDFRFIYSIPNLYLNAKFKIENR